MESRHRGRTCTEVPALAGSMPIMANPNGSAVPVSTELITMQNSDAEIATESMMLPSVIYTRANPATAPVATVLKLICAHTLWTWWKRQEVSVKGTHHQTHQKH